MSIATKFIVFFFLLSFSEVYSLKLNIEAHRVAKRTGSTTLVMAGDSPLVRAIQERFSKLGADLDKSKLFNFLIGAVSKAVSLLEGNEIASIVKCAVMGVEIWWNALKFPAKSVDEIKAEVKAELDDKKAGAALKEGETSDKSEDQAVIDGMKGGEVTAHELNCEAQSELMKDPNGLDFIDDVGTTEEQPDAKTAKFIEKHQLPSLKKLKAKLSKKFQGLKDKFGGFVEKFKAKLAAFQKTLLDWLAKPIVKALIAFFECALVPILTMILKGGASFAGMITGMSLINIVKQGPKFLKMVLDGIKSIRTGFTKNNIKEKWNEYGKGTANFIMLVVLSVMGS